MPIITRMKKSGRKRVYNQNGEGLQGRLNESAREIFQGKRREITPGIAGLRDPLIRAQSGTKTEQIQRLRRRRALGSLPSDLKMLGIKRRKKAG